MMSMMSGSYRIREVSPDAEIDVLARGFFFFGFRNGKDKDSWPF